MKLGVSLSPAFLTGRAESDQQKQMLLSSGGAPGFLHRLREAGATHIELRAVYPDRAPAEVTGSVLAAQKAGFSLTVHGYLADEPAVVFWGRMLPVLDAQPALTVTVHSAENREKTLLLLQRFSEYAAAHHPDARLALENNRSALGDKLDLVECAGVLNTLRQLDMPNVGSCWDFGHFCWDHQAHPLAMPDDLPPEGFIQRAIHTHIHSILGHTTHFPLTMGELPLRKYLNALHAAGYTGVYNLEPEPERWEKSIDAATEIVRSVEILREALSKTGGNLR